MRGSRFVPFGVLAVLVAAVVGIKLYVDRNDVNKKYANAIAAARREDPETALRKLDGLLASPELAGVSSETEAKVGAAIVEISARMVPSPFARANLDQAGRLVRRYQTLSHRARDGVSRDAMLAAIDGWANALVAPEDQEAKLALLVHASKVTDTRRSAAISQRIVAVRKVAAEHRATTAPLDALAIALESPRDDACIAVATKILADLVEQPSLLDEASVEVDAWLASVPQSEPMRAVIESQRALARDARRETEAEGVTADQLTAILAKRRWDQRAALALARLDVAAGRIDAADARLRAFGAPAMLVRDARVELANIAMQQGKLEIADELLANMLGIRLERFLAASAALDAAVNKLVAEVDNQLALGEPPAELKKRLANAPEEKHQEISARWFEEFSGSDPGVQEARASVLAHSDVVAIAIAAGTVKLRRAQQLQGAARDVMLTAAEQTFLAIRLAAEGDPSFHIGLAEIYARLGKTAESDAELDRIIAQNVPALTMQVIYVYRALGNVERAKQLATGVYNTSASPTKENAAQLLGLLEIDADLREQWYRKANQDDPHVQLALMELEGTRAMQKGDYAECARKYTAVAAGHLARAQIEPASSYNNAAVAQQHRFACSGDVRALRDAEVALEKAYRTLPSDPIIIGNLAYLHATNADLRVLDKRIDLRALQLLPSDAAALIDLLLEYDERDVVIASLVADPSWRRSHELLSQLEVLAPSNTVGYEGLFARAERLRDEATASSIVDRMRKAKLDTSETEAQLAQLRDGSAEAKAKPQLEAARSRFERVLAGQHDARTKAAAGTMLAQTLFRLALIERDPNLMQVARSSQEQAGKAWPAIARPPGVTYAIDVEGLAADGKRWSELRRERSAIEILAKLVADGDPLAAKIRASASWPSVPELARARKGKPNLDDVRLARLLGDKALEDRAIAAFDDSLLRSRIALNALLSPSSAAARAEVDYLARR